MFTREAPVQEQEAPQTTPPPAPAPRAHQEERRLVAWLGKSVLFKGDLISSEDLTIDGEVVGSVEVKDHRLTVGPDAVIQADIVANVVIVLGTVMGKITAHYKADIRNTGIVTGDIYAPRLAMADGAVLQGSVHPTPRDRKS